MRDAGGCNAFPAIQVDPELIPDRRDRFKRQVEFLLEIDKLKNTLRQTVLLDRGRHENSAEHSWHIALGASIFSEYAAADGIDLCRVIRMLLIHDVVEIDAGDTYCYDEDAKIDQCERERRAADRIFASLPADQTEAFHSLWNEFEAGKSAESLYAGAIDRFQAFLHNYFTRGQIWQQHGIRRHQVIQRMQPVKNGAPLLWDYVCRLIEDAVQKGFLLP